MNEASARIKINKLLEEAGWRFFDEPEGPANIQLEAGVKLRPDDLDALGNDFEHIKTKRGVVDFLLLDDKGFPLVVLEAKSEAKNPLTGKEQARSYARSQNCRFVILSNGALHFFWDIEHGNPRVITVFPAQDSVGVYKQFVPNPKRLVDQRVGDDYIALTQRPTYAAEAAWRDEDERPDYIRANNLRFLREYQVRAVHALQRAVRDGADRFLFEMATGTGKTLTAAAVIKLFLRTANARRVLFLVDRLELEEQARKVFTGLLSNDYRTVVYKENRTDWSSAEIVVSTVQSLLFDNKYRRLFSPTDFDLVISDEAHRSIGGNARALFEHFVGYKLGLTATPRDYLRGFDELGPSVRDPREAERRLLLDTYRTFGCESGQPTFRYSLLDGVKDGILINPTVVDARTGVTTQLLSEEGFIALFSDDLGEDHEEAFTQRQYEKRFFSESTNDLFCKTFLEHALRDPVSGEIGKSIVFAVSQEHAARLTQILNQIADRMFPGHYQSDFAVQVTSHVADAQRFTVNFANNHLLGVSDAVTGYRTSKARVCVTVGMMTTGYDCPDILNLGLFRPVFSPTDFVQIKGRGTRLHDFRDDLLDKDLTESIDRPEKSAFKLFDFFGNNEYFEEDFNYDEVLKLPTTHVEYENGGETVPVQSDGVYEHAGGDTLASIRQETIGFQGMKIDRMLFDRFADTVREDPVVAEAVEAEQWDLAVDHVSRNHFEKPEDYFNLAKLRKAVDADRRISLREILERAFGRIERFKSLDELLDEEFDKFIVDRQPGEPGDLPALRSFFKAYASDEHTRRIIDDRTYTDLDTNPTFTLDDFISLPDEFRKVIPEYIKDYVSLNQFIS